MPFYDSLPIDLYNPKGQYLSLVPCDNFDKEHVWNTMKTVYLVQSRITLVLIWNKYEEYLN